MDYAREQVDEFIEKFLDEVSAPISTDARYKIANNTQGMGGSCDLDLWEPYNADCDNIRVAIPSVPRGGMLVYDDDIAEIELIETEKNNMARSRVRERGDEYSGGQESDWSNSNNQRPWEDAKPGIYTMYNNPNNEIRDIKSENLYRRLVKENEGEIMVGGVPVGGVNVGGVNVGGVNVGGNVEGLLMRQQGVSGSYGSGLIGGKRELPQALKVWNAALQMWNEDKDKYCIPKKGTKAYDEVRAIADDMKKAVKSTKKPAAKKPAAKKPAAKKPAAKKPAAKKAPAKRASAKKTVEDELVELMKKFVDEYNLDSIKKQNLTPSNYKEYIDKYNDKVKKINGLLEKIDRDSFLRGLRETDSTRSLYFGYVDVSKNFSRRVKARLRSAPKPKKSEPARLPSAMEEVMQSAIKNALTGKKETTVLIEPSKRMPAGRRATKAKVKQPAAKKPAAKKPAAKKPAAKKPVAKKPAAKPMEEIELELNERLKEFEKTQPTGRRGPINIASHRLKEFEKTQPTGRRGPINIASHRKPVAKKPAVKAKTQRQRERQRKRRTKQNVENPKEVTFNNQPEENLESMLVDFI
jgi:histone H1/5